MSTEQLPSVFTHLVNKLRNKDEAELKLLYMQVCANELSREWRQITEDSDFANATEDDIVAAIQKSRYIPKNV